MNGLVSRCPALSASNSADFAECQPWPQSEFTVYKKDRLDPGDQRNLTLKPIFFSYLLADAG
jgi:hypothetical protein